MPAPRPYRADRVLPDDELAAQYEQIVAAIAPHSDVLLCETMSLAREGRAAALAASRAGMALDTVRCSESSVRRSGCSDCVQF